MSYILTEIGKKTVSQYITELEAKRKEILDAHLDTADDTNIPTESDILDDVNFMFGVDEDGEYYNGWACTDHYDSDYPLNLRVGTELQLVND